MNWNTDVKCRRYEAHPEAMMNANGGSHRWDGDSPCSHPIELDPVCEANQPHTVHTDRLIHDPASNLWLCDNHRNVLD